VTREQLRVIERQLRERGRPGDWELAGVGHTVENYLAILDRQIVLAARVLSGLNELAHRLAEGEPVEALEELGLVGDQLRLVRSLEAVRDSLRRNVEAQLVQGLAGLT
jgi:hypothetical protein